MVNSEIKQTDNKLLMLPTLGFVVGPAGYGNISIINDTTINSKLSETKKILLNTYYGVYFTFRQYLKVKGLGYLIKYEEPTHTLCLIFGRSNHEYIQLPETIQVVIKPKKKKQVYKLVATDEQILNSFCKHLQSKFKPDPYRAKGIRFVKEKLVLKPGKKKK